MVFLMAAAAHADYKTLYAEGVTAIRRDKWRDAERLLRAAIAENPKEDKRAIYINFDDTPPYVPHYYLGLALLRQNRPCAEVMGAWEISQSQGVIQSTREFAVLKKLMKPCPVDASLVADAARKANEAIAGSVRLLEPLQQGAADPIWSSNPALVEKRTAATERLEQARALARQAQGAGNIKDLNRAAELAGAVGQEAISLTAQLDTLRKNQQQAQQAQARDIQELTRLRNAIAEKSNRGSGILSRLREVARPPADILAYRKRLEGAVQRAQRNGAGASKADLSKWDTELADLLVGSTQILGRLPASTASKAPPELVAAARSYFEGNYRKTIDQVNAAKFEDRALAQARLFRAASAYSLYVMSGSKDEALRQVAVSDARECRKAALTPSRQYFSPTFIAFYASAK